MGGGESDNSYSFDVGDNIEKELADIFGIKNEEDREQFRDKYRFAISGDGNEGKRIFILHSSALCHLLFFYSATPDHPIRLAIQGKDTEFTDTEFEYKNRVFKGGHASNVDVVLISRDKKTVLFLESKFSEYYLSGNESKLTFSKAYLDETKCRYAAEVYGDSALMSKMGITVQENGKDAELQPGEPAYLYGIKQMVSHYVGIRNLIDSVSASDGSQGSVIDDRKDVPNAIANGANVYLGEILFDRGIETLENNSGKPCFTAYEAMYRELANGLNACIEKSTSRGRFHVIGDLFQYSKLEDCEFVNERIRTFYFGK